MRRIVLASGSPRRRELLSQTGLNFEVIPGDIDEAAVIAALAGQRPGAEPESGAGVSGAKPEPEGRGKAQKSAGLPAGDSEGRLFASRVVEALSRAKAESAAAQVAEGVVIGSDTIVWNGRILGKPKDRTEAYAMIQALQGRTHSVFTGVTVLVKRDAAVAAIGEGTSAGGDVSAGKDASVDSVLVDRDMSVDGTSAGGASENSLLRHTFSCETKVRVYPMTDAEIEQYLDAGEYTDKAGAYGIQGKFGLWVQSIEGDYNNVVGLPLSALWQVLKQYL